MKRTIVFFSALAALSAAAMSLDGEWRLDYFPQPDDGAVRTLPILQFSETLPEDLNTAQEDHFADSFRYFCMSRPIAPTAAKSLPAPADDPLELSAGRYRGFSY